MKSANVDSSTYIDFCVESIDSKFEIANLPKNI